MRERSWAGKLLHQSINFTPIPQNQIPITKHHQQKRDLPLGIEHDPAFLLTCIDDALRFAHTLARRRAALSLSLPVVTDGVSVSKKGIEVTD
jgi:hypothetical protein